MRSAIAFLASIIAAQLVHTAACRCAGAEPSPERIVAPKIWDAEQLKSWALPLAGLGEPPSFASEEQYYAAPIDNLRTYPVYHPDREPPGYRESLLRIGPKPLIEPAALVTEADWIEAGRRVFEELDTAVSRSDDPEVIAHFSDGRAVDRYRDATHDVMTADGVLLDYRWVVDNDRKLKLSLSSCAGCHSRLMPDGSVLPGAPSNFDLSDSPVVDKLLAALPESAAEGIRGPVLYAQHGVPWVRDDVHLPFRTMPDEQVLEFLKLETGEPPGTMFVRFNGSPYFGTRMADLRGVRHRRYLDTTGTHENRGPADIARYGILVEFAESTVFGPHRMVPPEFFRIPVRPPDEAMYALALYLYSLEPAPSPYPLNDQARRGKDIFETEGCFKCHTPPIYTNNTLVPVPGFDPPLNDPRTARLAISERRVDTDPGLALRTRKGTGYYKVPSLRGLWYRGLYGHSGSVTSLDDWFDPRRLQEDYVPSGWRGPGVRTRAIPGHEFGLDLPEEDRKALIAFLLTL